MVRRCPNIYGKYDMPSVNSADDKLIFFLFSQKIASDISCKFSHKETICMKCETYFLGKIRKNISKCCLLIFLTHYAKH